MHEDLSCSETESEDLEGVALMDMTYLLCLQYFSGSSRYPNGDRLASHDSSKP